MRLTGAVAIGLGCWLLPVPAWAQLANGVEPQHRVHVDIGPSLILRSGAASGNAQMFDDNPRVSGWLRGTFWFGHRAPACPIGSCWRWGVWLGYRDEPGPTASMFYGPGTKGVQTWMLAHDFDLGLVFEHASQLETWLATFLRFHAAPGLSLTTLQLRSLDDTHVYSQTTGAFNASLSMEFGVRLANTLELFVGEGWLFVAPSAKLDLRHADNAGFPVVASPIEGVSRAGALLFGGVGVEF